MRSSSTFLGTDSTEGLAIVCRRLQAYQSFRDDSTELVEVLPRSDRLLETPLTSPYVPFPEPELNRRPSEFREKWPALVGSIILLVTLAGLCRLAPPTLAWAFPSGQEILKRETAFALHPANLRGQFEVGALYDVPLPDNVGGGTAHHCRFKGTIRSIASLPPNPVEGDMYFSTQDQALWIWMSRSGHALEWVDP